jgi:uncharacterized protein YndB with AHSA1/START domain
MDTHVAATERDLVMARIIPAPPAAVFAAWVEPEQVKAWWGPYGMTTPECAVDLRPGGVHRTLMRDAAGQAYPNHMAIDAVEAPHRLVLRVLEEGSCPLVGATGTILFAPDGDATRLEVRWRHPTAEMRAAHQAMGFAKGWGETLDKLTAHLVRPVAACPGSTMPEPQHGWLHRLLGEWSFESECVGPNGEAMRASGVERVRTLGGYWVVGESEGEMPGGGPARWIVSMGYDPVARRFRGSFIGSMMAHMFVYDGQLAEDGQALILDTEGPAMTGEGTARYRDVVRMEGDDARSVTSEVQGVDGRWTTFMTARFRRVA